MEAIQEVELSSEGSEDMGNRGVLHELQEVNVENVPQVATPPFPNLPPNHNDSKFKKLTPAPLDVLKNVRINITLDSPRSTLKGFLKEPMQKNLNFNEVELKKVEDQLRKAFIEFYQTLRLLKSYR